MQPHERQKSHWMNFGTVSFSNLLPSPIKDAYSRHFSEFPQSQDAAGRFNEKRLYVEDGFAGAIRPSRGLPARLRPPRRSCCGRSDVCRASSSPRCRRGQGSWVGSIEEGIREGSHHKDPPLPPRRCSSWRGRSFGRGWRVTVGLWEHGGIRSVVTVAVFSVTTTKRAGVSKRRKQRRERNTEREGNEQLNHGNVSWY